MRRYRRLKHPGLSLPERKKITAEVVQAATDHLNARDAETALSHFTTDVIAVTNTHLFPALKELTADVNEYYRSLKQVDLAEWQDMLIRVINDSTALVTAKCRYSYTDKDDQRTDLEGIWTALYIRVHRTWKILLRHESFDETRRNE